MKIEVTQQNINDGRKHNCTSCPIALAIYQATGEEAAVSCFRTYLGEDCAGIALPSSAALFIERFDAGKSVSPFSFDLPIPTPLVNKEQKQK
jgi:hypothetical protein